MDIKIKKRLLWATALSVILMALLLSKVDWDHFLSIAKRVDILYFSLSFVLLLGGNYIRAFRFYKIDHTGNKLSHWWIINQIYNFITATLPGGAGEAATAYMIKRFSALNMFSAFRILILSRIMDLAGLSSLLLVTAILTSESTPYRGIALLISGAVFIFSIILSHPKSERFIIRLLQKMPVRINFINRACERLEEVATISEHRFSGTFYCITMLQSVLIIFSAALSVHFMLLSFGTGFMLTQSFYCFGVYALFQVVPVQGIAGIGTQAAWWSLALTIAGYKASDVIAMGIILHGTFYVLITIVALSALLFWLVIRKNNRQIPLILLLLLK